MDEILSYISMLMAPILPHEWLPVAFDKGVATDHCCLSYTYNNNLPLSWVNSNAHIFEDDTTIGDADSQTQLHKYLSND